MDQQRVSCQHAYQWTESDWRLGYGYASQPTIDYRNRALDFCVKQKPYYVD